MAPAPASDRALSPGRYPAIADYGFIGGLYTGALVSRGGSIDQCCLPRFDSPSVFGRLLDRQRGGFVEITTPDARQVHRRYLPGATVLKTTFQTDSGIAVLTDFFPLPVAGPGAVEPPRIIRILRCGTGSVASRLTCAPRFDYAHGTPTIDIQGSHVAVAHGGSQRLAVHCSLPLRTDAATLRAHGTLRAGETLRTALVWQPPQAPPAAGPDPPGPPASPLPPRPRSAWRRSVALPRSAGQAAGQSHRQGA